MLPQLVWIRRFNRSVAPGWIGFAFIPSFLSVHEVLFCNKLSKIVFLHNRKQIIEALKMKNRSGLISVWLWNSKDGGS